MYNERKLFYEKIEKERGSKVIAYVTGDRENLGTQIGSDVPDILIEHLDVIGKVLSGKLNEAPSVTLHGAVSTYPQVHSAV